ncbi:phage tail tube protein [Burkholderia vietnamiensis]|uniref:phage tail tube protein n=1 Tax=Burkholderia vietnamiensis TaxID=60552 RepID=UPI00075B1251|nr:phage tail tube protein [Burkholderia vietnamiensis]KVF81841.1 phage tail protein [Burkholderia vietnamiensis]KVF85919.1 phage tail protein [Burkholderia vietnamiensis]KVF89460.1 phage tail protein [Burkholderia vietnamiensis]KVG01299.1 phage tail protein [Burkholderia vietnamiensis]MBR8049561.1 phage tail tube protein [Burkholderia vietnamiensis]
MGQKVAGTAYVKADGEQFSVTGGVECPLSDVKRESILPGLYKEEDRVPYVKVDAVFEKSFPIEKIQSADDMVVTVEFKNGRVYVLSGAYVVGEPAATGDDGKASLEFNGVKGRWQ